jgi:hypothetical protein
MQAPSIEIGYSSLMRHRLIFLFSSLAFGSAGAFGLASCSSPKIIEDEASTEGGTDGNMADVKTDAGTDGPIKQKCPSYPTKGECDLVAQDCAGGKECVIVPSDGGFAARCEDPSSGSVPKGGVCSTTADCVAGGRCIMNRCSPHCCTLGDNTPCGVSVPEGFIGTCGINLKDQQTSIDLGLFCTFNAACKPYKIQPCPSDYTCLVEDMSGSAKCVQIYMTPGKTVGQTCTAANDCQDGMMCVGGGPDGGSVCMWVCYKGGGPYPANISSLPAGQGGCPANKMCNIGITGLPTWLAVCSL